MDTWLYGRVFTDHAPPFAIEFGHAPRNLSRTIKRWNRKDNRHHVFGNRYTEKGIQGCSFRF